MDLVPESASRQDSTLVDSPSAFGKARLNERGPPHACRKYVSPADTFITIVLLKGSAHRPWTIMPHDAQGGRHLAPRLRMYR